MSEPVIPPYNFGAEGLQNRIIVNQSNLVQTLGGTIQSQKEYFIDGIVDFTGLSSSVEIPDTGIELRGYSFDTSKILCSDNSYTLFNSPVGGSGNIIAQDIAIEITGTSSKVFDLKSATANEAFEFSRINFNNCVSLGTIDNYRQGFENGTGRFGGSPTLELKGTWTGGYFVTSSIVRGMDNITTEPLFKAGAGFVMQSRFFNSMNINLGTNMPFFDFAEANFPNSSTLQIEGAFITRNGLNNATDPNINPNITADSLSSAWKFNNGMTNTHVGGTNTITTEIQTTITAINTFVPLAGTFTTSSLVHFDEPSNGQLRHLGDNPRDFIFIADIILDGTQNSELTLRIKKYNASTTSFETVLDQRRQVNNLLGTRDVALFNITTNITLDQDDYAFLEVANNTGIQDVTGENTSYFLLIER